MNLLWWTGAEKEKEQWRTELPGKASIIESMLGYDQPNPSASSASAQDPDADPGGEVSGAAPDNDSADKERRARATIMDVVHGINKNTVAEASLGQLRGMNAELDSAIAQRDSQAKWKEMSARWQDYAAQADLRKQQADSDGASGNVAQLYAKLRTTGYGNSAQDGETDDSGAQPLPPKQAFLQALAQYPAGGGKNFGKTMKAIMDWEGQTGGDATGSFQEDPVTGVRQFIAGKTVRPSGVNPDKVPTRTLSNQLMPLLDPVTQQPIQGMGIDPNSGERVDFRDRHPEKPVADEPGVDDLKRELAVLVKAKAAGTTKAALGSDGVANVSPHFWQSSEPIDDVITRVQGAIDQLGTKATALPAGVPGASPSNPAAPITVKDYSALPKGAYYTDPKTKKMFRKK